ncbi:helix-turn-helix domain-containing protein [Altererythrobacter salegens]|uniref:Helix-turn-helix domain-containing protein n=1 Tax=Croceibacterium salegens TaxID=1737568 RepID=A0A6I4SU45_9SPHN|nr:helix-turn-helix transcriptional regulator [Croceibacterium salegens]MXO59461.1 helix-turn-helix domain-containing protein [Croceibacterium salegens]
MDIAIRCLAATYYGGFHIAPHRHHWGQLIYAGSGVMRVRAGGMFWIVPPARAVWVPVGAEHEIHGLGDFAMRTLYFPQEMVSDLPGECCALDVTPLLRELVLDLVERAPVAWEDKAGMRLAQVAIDRIAEARTLPLQLPMPSDPRAVRLATILRDDPASPASLSELARAAGASARTIQRLFLSETGMPFAQWRQRLRLLHGATELGAGRSVTEAGLAAGYAGTSAFIAAFRKHFGFTPSQLG